MFRKPNSLQVSKPSERGWFISPVENLEVWAMFAGALPAILLYVLLFMETSICQLIMLDKTKGKKGVGVHLDIVLLSGLNCLSSKLCFNLLIWNVLCIAKWLVLMQSIKIISNILIFIKKDKILKIDKTLKIDKIILK